MQKRKTKNELVFRFSYFIFENEKRKTNSKNEKRKNGIYTDRIAHCKWIHNVLFADDTSICYSANKSDVVTYELGILYLMFRVSHLSLITIKTNVMRFPNNIQPRACVNIVLKGTNIEQV